MYKGDDLQDRLSQFAARSIKLFNDLQRSEAGKHISPQVVRCATVPAAFHGEARSAESPADFVHKLKIATKELNESEVWLRIAVASGDITIAKASDLIEERIQLQRILNASIKTTCKSINR